MVLVLTLPSDSSLEYFPDNTLSHFRVHLSHELDFSGPYEVGLTQLHYPRSWNNIPTDEVEIGIKLVGCEDGGATEEETSPPLEPLKCRIPAELTIHLSSSLNRLIKR